MQLTGTGVLHASFMQDLAHSISKAQILHRPEYRDSILELRESELAVLTAFAVV